MNFRSDHGIWKTAALFYERVEAKDRDKVKPIFTLFEEDRVEKGITFISLYKLYMESVDEYDFATTHLGGMPHWRSICKSRWFEEGTGVHKGVAHWRTDLKARDESLARKVLLLAVRDGDIPAAKKLYDISKPTVVTRKSQVKKEEQNKEAANKMRDKEFLDNAALRLNVVSIRD